MAVGGGEQLLQCFRESSSNILKLSEIQQWWGKRGSEEKQLQVTRHTCLYSVTVLHL